jgi:hypothetical protein
MNTFGIIKSKLVKKLTESYISKNKSEIKEIVGIMKSNKEFKDLYLFYEDVETKFIDDPETAKLYAEEIGHMLKNKNILVENTCDLLSKKLDGVVIENNAVYDALDQLLDIDSLKNIEKKVKAKKKIFDYVTTEKKRAIAETTEFTKNETLLHAVMANDFNSYYSETLNEEEQDELKKILSLSKEELQNNMNSLKEELLNKIDKIITESSQDKNDDVIEKLEKVKTEVKNSDTSRYNYYKLKTLITEI